MSQEDVSPAPPQAQPIQLVSTAQGPQVGPYVFGKTLGTGSTGKVKLAKNLDTGEIVAIKIVRKDFLDKRPSLKRKMRREISVLKLLSHPNLMSLIDVFEIETHLFLVMEYVHGCELFEYLVRHGALPPHKALVFFQQIICGLDYCHKRLVCHRDLKPENLLLDLHLNIKIADFGMTSLNRPGSLLETSCGSPHYCDPMVVSGEKYDGLMADIWSCGVILYAMVTGRLPFDDDNIQRLLQKVQVGQYHLPADLPEDLRSLIKSMLTVDPDIRITLEDIKKHPWFNSIPMKNCVTDDFEAPTEPVLQPDRHVVQSLVDLGWGDKEAIIEQLSVVGPNMEKVFYVQLERHPMFHRSTLTRSTPAPPAAVAESTHSSASAKEQAAPAVGSAPSGPSVSASVPDPSSQNLDTKLANVSIGTAAPSGAADASETAGSGSRAGANLKRQSSLIRFSAQKDAAANANHSDADEAIQSVAGSEQRSWFDSVRNYLTGQGQSDEEGEEGGARTQG